MKKNILFTPRKLANLKTAYKSAIESGADQFTFDGYPLLVTYAKYLIEYLDTQLAAYGQEGLKRAI